MPPCSFSHKSQADHGVKLISSPNADPRTYICHECVQVAAAIVEESQIARPAQPVPPPPEPPHESPFAQPATADLLYCVESWIAREASGADASSELAQIRNLARLMFVKTNDR